MADCSNLATVAQLEALAQRVTALENQVQRIEQLEQIITQLEERVTKIEQDLAEGVDIYDAITSYFGGVF
jgi:ribosomal protein L9